MCSLVIFNSICCYVLELKACPIPVVLTWLMASLVPRLPSTPSSLPFTQCRYGCHGGGHLLSSSSLTLVAIAVGVAVPIAALCTLLVISTTAVIVARKKISKSRMVCVCVCVWTGVGRCYLVCTTDSCLQSCSYLFLMSHDMWHREGYRCSYMLGTPVTMGALC